MNNLVGKSISHYYFIEPLDEGAMAVVYKACEAQLECILAVGQARISSAIAATLPISINTAQPWRNRFSKAQTISYDDLSLGERL